MGRRKRCRATFTTGQRTAGQHDHVKYEQGCDVMDALLNVLEIGVVTHIGREVREQQALPTWSVTVGELVLVQACSVLRRLAYAEGLAWLLRESAGY
eukprot:SAG11_NODE_431_length_9526_cov_11.297019_8_plen_97_part_00